MNYRLRSIVKAEEMAETVSKHLGEPPLDYPLALSHIRKFFSKEEIDSIPFLTLKRKLSERGYIICRTPGTWRR